MSLGPPNPESSTVDRIGPDILTYSYASRMVYVAPGQNYDEAIDIAQESFPELREVDRDRIGLEVRVVLSNQQERKKAEISRSAWSAVVTTLARFEIVEIRVGLPSNSAAESSSSTVEPPPYASGTGWPSDVKGSQIPIVSNSPPISRSSSRTQSLANRVANLFTPKTS